jgi:hypothetical protein
MPIQVCTGAVLECTFGVAPASFTASGEDVSATTPAGVITDVEKENIPTFGMCVSLANPEVAAATTAALGVLTPMPCVPVLTPWVPGSLRVRVNGISALDDASECMCVYGGAITVTDPGQVEVMTE